MKGSKNLGQPGPYADDNVLKEEVARLASEYGVPPEQVAREVALREKSIHNEILEAAGSSVTADDAACRVELWQIAREIGLQKEYEENTITPLAFLTAVKHHFQPDENPAEIAPLVCKQSERDLAAWISEAHKHGLIEADNERQAIISAARHWLVRNSKGETKAIDGTSLWVNYRQKKDKDAGKV